MPNTHGFPDVGQEIQGICGDLLAPAVLATSLAVPVPASLTLPAFSTYAYVRVGTPTRLTYVNQGTEPVTLAGGDGPYWLAISHSVATPPAGWLRAEGTHYLWRAAGTQPADPPGGLVFAGVTVAGGVISAVNTGINYPNTKVAYGGPTGGLAFDSNLTWNGSTLTVRNSVDARHVFVGDHAGDSVVAFHSTLNAAGGTNRFLLHSGGTAPSYHAGPFTMASTLTVTGAVGVGSTLQANGAVSFLNTLYVAALSSLASTNISGSLYTTGQVRAVGSLYVDGMSVLTGAAGLGGASDSRFSLRSYGSSFFDGLVGLAMIPVYRLDVNGDTRLSGVVGIGRVPDIGYSLITLGAVYSGGAFSAVGATTCYSTLWVGGGVTLGSTLAVAGGTTLNSTLWVAGGATLNGHTIMGTAGTTGNLTCAATFGTQYIQSGAETGLMRAPVAGWALSVGGAIQSNNAIANKLGAGPWGESSSRHLKRHIEDIPDALALLLAQHGRRYEWEEPERAAAMPGPQHGFVFDEVTIPQWRDSPADGADVLTLRGFEALTVEALRAIVARLDALERN